jgi:hypothetical protein
LAHSVTNGWNESSMQSSATKSGVFRPIQIKSRSDRGG